MDTYDYHAISTQFLDELKQASAGKLSSLLYGKNTIPEKPIVPLGEEFQVLAVGGTNYVCANLRREDNGLQILSVDEGKVPIFISENTFLSFIAYLVKPTTKYLSLNIGFPIEPETSSGVLDSRLLYGSKEHSFTGLENKLIGQTVSAYLQAQRKQKVVVSVANDTVCLLLSGLTQLPWNQLAAGIVGTGTNYAIFDSAVTAINLEAGSFDKFPLLASTVAFDTQTIKPGTCLFEKETSGKYLPEQFNYIAKLRRLEIEPIADAVALSEIAAQESSEASKTAREVLQRSANLVACGCAAIATFHNRDITFVMQGSVFWKGYQYKEMVAEQYEKLLPGCSFKMITINHSDILGAAKLIA